MHPLVLGGAIFNGLVLAAAGLKLIKPHQATNALLVGLSAIAIGLAKEEERSNPILKQAPGF